MHVYKGLLVGIVSAVGLGIAVLPDYTLAQSLTQVGQGMWGSASLGALAMAVTGLSALMEHQGGFAWLQLYLMRFIAACERCFMTAKQHSWPTEMAIMLLVACTNVFTANNTVAIVLVADMAKRMGNRIGLTPQRVACTLDIFSCVVQGLLPYTIQCIVLASAFAMSPLTVVSHSIYLILLAAVALLSLTYSRR